MVVAYPTFICKEKKDYLVCVPDLDIFTEGKSLENAIIMAREAIGIQIVEREKNNIIVPKPSDYKNAVQKAKSNAEIYDYSKGLVTMVDVDITEFRKKYDNKTVRRNVTLPNWMDLEAKRLKLNVSGILQEALVKTFNSRK